ncbi:MAPK-interacting and spindle-stabilizing protein-like [Macrobrachium rosenbergii]|uniref:MAPK-interacting and spindle-stabilizing protein-like n=1 Tax=Macrobrachium rosenbergii TaxID=79674 RepID=UPI0034D431D3
MFCLVVAKHIPGGYDVLLGQDFTSPSKPRQFRGPNSPNNPPDPSPVPGTASEPVPRSQPDLPSGEPRQSTPLPVPLGRTEQCQSLSVQTDETTTTSLPAPVPMPVPEHAPDPPPRDPTPNPLSSPGLVPLPVLVARETGIPDPSGGSPKGTDS